MTLWSVWINFVAGLIPEVFTPRFEDKIVPFQVLHFCVNIDRGRCWKVEEGSNNRRIHCNRYLGAEPQGVQRQNPWLEKGFKGRIPLKVRAF